MLISIPRFHMLTIRVSLAKLRPGDGQTNDLQGTVEYFAPEMAVQCISNAGSSTHAIRLEGGDGSNSTKKTDIWALGYVNILGR